MSLSEQEEKHSVEALVAEEVAKVLEKQLLVLISKLKADAEADRTNGGGK